MSYFRRCLIEKIKENQDFLIFIFQHLANSWNPCEPNTYFSIIALLSAE